MKPITRLAERISRLPLCTDACLDTLRRLIGLLLAGILMLQIWLYQDNLMLWDLLLISGFVILLIGLHFLHEIPGKFEHMVERLRIRQVLELDDKQASGLKLEIADEAAKWSRVMGFLLACFMLLAFSIALTKSFAWPRLLLGLVEVSLTYLVGSFLGRMAYYGRFGALLKRKQIKVNIDPEHVDGVGGLKPVGDYYFYQAMIVAIPAIFLAVWVLLIPWWPRDYSHWYESYTVLLAVTIAVEIMAFLVPLLAFRRIILDERRQLQRKADQSSVEIQRILQQIRNGETGNKPEAELKALEARYWAIEKMRTWPVHPQLRRRFGVNNLLLLLPLISDLMHRSFDIKKIFSAISKWTI